MNAIELNGHFVHEINFNPNTAEFTYRLSNGETIIQKAKPLTREEARQKFISIFSNLNLDLKFNQETQEFTFISESAENFPLIAYVFHTAPKHFQRLRNYEIETRLLELTGESFVVSEPCPFNGEYTHYFIQKGKAFEVAPGFRS